MSDDGTREKYEQRADRAGLRYVDYRSTAGISRIRRGKGFSYHRPGKNRELIERGSRTWNRIDQLTIPPAWQDVWISSDPMAHVLAVGRDSEGRRQSIYHPEWNKISQQTKFERMIEFADALSSIRRRIRRESATAGLGRDRVLAAIVLLMDRTLIRVGNEASAGSGVSYGLTTLRAEHASAQADGTIQLAFLAKGSKPAEATISHASLIEVIQRCQELPGQRLFRYIDENDRARDVHSEDINGYLSQHMGQGFTAKDFRTWGGSSRFANFAYGDCRKADAVIDDAMILRAIDQVAASLNNTRTVARSHYIHHALPPTVTNGDLVRAFKETHKTRQGMLKWAERATYALI